MNHLNIIRKIAWSFHCDTGVDWDDLFGEAYLASCEALRSYHINSECKESTYVYGCMKNSLINFCNNEKRNNNPVGIEDWVGSYYTPVYEFYYSCDDNGSNILTKDSRYIINMVVKRRLRYAMPPKSAVGLIKKDLLSRGWYPHRIWKALKVLKEKLI